VLTPFTGVKEKSQGMAEVTAKSGVSSTRRERLRAQTLADLGSAARQLLVEEGSHAVTLAAVAAEVGMSAPALYRYVDNRDGLLRLVAASVAGELVGTLVDARRTAGDDPLTQTLAVCRAFRAWALAHQREFTLLFADTSVTRGDKAGPSAAAVAWAFEEIVLRLWAARRFAVPADSDLTDDLRATLEPYRARLAASASAAGIAVGEIPLGATYTLLHYWTRVYGLVSMEISGHLDHAVIDAGPLFEAVLAELSAQVTAD
jgi:AcrR family transcriptional regulator